MSSEARDTLWARFVAGQTATGARPENSDMTDDVKARGMGIVAELETLGIQPIGIVAKTAGGLDITFAERGGRMAVVGIRNDGRTVLSLRESLLAPRCFDAESDKAAKTVAWFLDRGRSGQLTKAGVA